MSIVPQDPDSKPEPRIANNMLAELQAEARQLIDSGAV